MAIKMQQRRGTAAQWTSANPVLGSGELGYETDTNYFKLGDGIATWTALPYYKNITGVNALIGTYISTEVTNRDSAIASAIAAEVTNRDSAVSSAISTEVTNRNSAITSAISTEVTNRNSAIATAKSEAGTIASGYVSTHNSATTNVHGISDTSALVTTTGTQTLTGKTLSAADNTVTVNLTDVIDITATVSEVNKLAGLATTKTELGYVNGVTSAIQTQIDAKAPKSGPTFTGTLTAADVSISGNLTVSGTTTSVNATNLEITDPIIYIATGNSANANDIGVVGHATVSGTYQHMGLVRDHADGKWKLFSGVTTEPTNVIAFSDSTAAYDTLKVGGIDFSDGTQVKQGVPSITAINQQAGAYTTILADRDKLVEVSSASGVTLTIPANSSVAYPVGTSIDILQTGSGQVTIAGAGGVTVNATPGLKLRTQWSSATLFKRATDTWVVFGDLTT